MYQSAKSLKKIYCYNLPLYHTQNDSILWFCVISTGEYSILSDSSTILQEQTAILQPGQTGTILIDLEDDFPIGRDTQFKLTTTNGAIFVGTVVMGQNSG